MWSIRVRTAANWETNEQRISEREENEFSSLIFDFFYLNVRKQLKQWNKLFAANLRSSPTQSTKQKTNENKRKSDFVCPIYVIIQLNKLVAIPNRTAFNANGNTEWLDRNEIDEKKQKKTWNENEMRRINLVWMTTATAKRERKYLTRINARAKWERRS